MRREFAGIGAAKGLALGRARVREPHRLEIDERRIEPEEVEAERERMRDALAAARKELSDLRERVRGAIAHEVGEFIDLHSMLLDDPDLLHGLDELIRTARLSAGHALRMQRDRLAAVFDGIDDPYLRSRREDIDHVIGRVYAALQRNPASQVIGMAGEVLITDSVAPSELAQLAEGGVVAVITAQGSMLSHSAILARSLHLPLVVGVHEALAHINDGDALIVDGKTGRVIVEPSATDLQDFRNHQAAGSRERRALARLRGAATRTKDGVDIALFANAESREDVAQAHALGADGVGLYRTEFLFLQRRELPTEDEQFFAYRDLVLGMGGRPVTIRTLDLGADKADNSGLTLAREPNPALGLRGVRLCLAHQDVFCAQLRAILRASGYGPVRILVPMITAVSEIIAVRGLIDVCALAVRAAGHPMAEHVELGAMIEVPAAALAIDTILPEVDFCSVGTNDLIQYLLAIDRGNDALGPLCTPNHPAVQRVLRNVIQACKDAGKRIAVCGELAGAAEHTPMLLTLGLTEFSMHPSNMLEVRRAIRESDLGQLRASVV
ncbi:MAG: phosphoenolpyruvate--protein phosphotransferase [Pseudomarimonas sp.]